LIIHGPLAGRAGYFCVMLLFAELPTATDAIELFVITIGEVPPAVAAVKPIVVPLTLELIEAVFSCEFVKPALAVLLDTADKPMLLLAVLP
jgi:hypothetical protein